MSRPMRTRLAFLSAAIIFGFALLAFLNPLVGIRVIGLDVVDARGVSEVRATYGLMFLTMAITLFWAIPRRLRHGSYVRFIGILWGAACIGRIISIFVDMIITPLNLVKLGVQLLIAIPLLLAGYERPPRQDPDGLIAAGAIRYPRDKDAPEEALRAYRE
jgi:hypothetical protein